MEITFDHATFRWHGVEEWAYKLREGGERGMGWSEITRHTLAKPDEIGAGFELRYFELARDGYSSLEKHRHVHFVVALRGRGRALVGDEVVDLEPFAAVYVPPLAPHRWLNDGEEPFGFLCTVDRERDRPQPLDDHEWEALRANPATARYVF
jgi:mannose-6-phosphate isomerase-like protein (cupin superfamily)